MSGGYATGKLAENEIDPAFLLVEAAGCGIVGADWTVFCRRILEWRSATGFHDDVLVVRDANGHLKGVCVVQVFQGLLFGRQLDVPLFAIASAADEDGVILELLAALEAKAAEGACQAIRIWSQGGESWSRVIGNRQAAMSYSGVHIAVA